MIVTIYIKWAKHFKHIMQLILKNKNPGNRPTFIFKWQSRWSKEHKTCIKECYHQAHQGKIPTY